MLNPLRALFAAPLLRRIGFHARRVGGQMDGHFFTSLLTAIIGFVVLTAVLDGLARLAWQRQVPERISRGGRAEGAVAKSEEHRMSGFVPGSRPRRRAVGAFLFSAALALAACQPLGEGDADGSGADSSGDGGTGRLSIATGGTAGVYFPLGGGLAELISANIDGYTATAEETNASVDNMNLIGSGESDIAFVLGDTAADAVAGTGEFEGGAIEACTLGILYTNFTQLVASAESGITSVADLADQRVSLGEAGSGTEIIGLRILEAAGIDPDADIDRSQLGIAETVDALRDGTIDAGFWSGGLPTAGLVDYATTGDMVLIPTGEYGGDLRDTYGAYYLDSEIPAETYEGQTEAISVVGVPNVLVVSTSMDEGLQEQLTALLFDHKDDLVAVHAAAEELDQATADDVVFMDVCPGAQAFYGS